MPASSSDIKNTLRRALRERRHALSATERRAAAKIITARLATARAFRVAARIACYLPADGEVDTAAIIERVHTLGKELFLPVLSRIDHDRLWFARVQPDTPLRPNRYGILEPRVIPRLLVRAPTLDLILMPLVGFDAGGHRLGMGGGYYDRSLAFLAHRQHWRRPHLVGLAYECQKTSDLPHDPWDIPLDAVVTENTMYTVNTTDVDNV
jgi:5-formyltetrahydrofolate cyclo-ligase